MAFIIAAGAKLLAAITVKAVVGAVVKAVVTTALSIGISKLVAKRTSSKADQQAGGDGGGRVQLPPSTDNKIPVVYGTAFIGGSIIDAMLSTDQKTMWYVVALAEVTDTTAGSGYTFGNMYYDGKLAQFGSNGAVTGLTTNTTPAQTDTRCNGFLYIYTFPNGSGTCSNYPGQTAQTLLSTTNGVPAAQAWTSAQAMPNCAFAIVKVIYSTDAGTTGIGQLTAQLSNSLTAPGDCIKDYMINTRYGCAIPLANIDTASLTALNSYSNALIHYVPVGGGDATQARYRINGPLDTSQNCLENLQRLVDSCDSWLQYSELTGKWRIVINKLYDGYPTTSGLFLVDSSNLIGGIEVSPIDLNETYNQIEVAYPNTNIKDQTDYQIINLFETDPNLLSQNEAVNRLNLTLPMVNNAVQARYLAARRIYQSREDLVISFKLDFNGIQLEAGDVIRVDHEIYGWNDKLFRVSTVSEEKDTEGNLYALVQAFEYTDAIYEDIVEDYVPSFNTGLQDPNVINVPGTPSVTQSTATNGLITSFDVTSYVPDSGIILYMDFNYGTSSNVLTHRLYRTVQQSNGAPYTNSNLATPTYSNVSINVNDLTAGNYYWSVTARNNSSGKRSGASPVLTWAGANVVPYNSGSNTGGIAGSQVKANTIGFNNIVVGTSLAEVFGQMEAAIDGSTPILNFGAGQFNYGTATTGTYIGGSGGYLDGSNPGTNYVYPWYQGTSSTANGYVANSTGPLSPFAAGSILGNTGTDGFYIVGLVNFGTGRVANNIEGLDISGDLALVANIDCTVQVVPFTTFGNAPNTMNILTSSMTSVNLKANIPQRPTIDTVTYSSNSMGFTGGGIAIKNITSGARVYMTDSEIFVTKAKFSN